MKFTTILILGLMLLNCNEKHPKKLDATAIIDKSIASSGVQKLSNAKLAFDFRDIHFEAFRNDGKYSLIRMFKDSTTSVRDELHNKGFERTIDDSLVTVADSMATKYAASVNSVHYFAVLPFGLDGEAVNKKLLEDTVINEKNYRKVKVTFNEIGGGEDFEDEFIYWINAKTFKIEYMAYSFKEQDGEGLRFREAYNERYINGVRFVDYNNFKPKSKSAKLETLDQKYMNDGLELISKIELKNISIN